MRAILLPLIVGLVSAQNIEPRGTYLFLSFYFKTGRLLFRFFFFSNSMAQFVVGMNCQNYNFQKIGPVFVSYNHLSVHYYL